MRAREHLPLTCDVSTCENQPAGRRPGCSRCPPPVEGCRSIAGLIGAEDINPRADRPRAHRRSTPRRSTPRPAPIARRPGAHRAGADRAGAHRAGAHRQLAPPPIEIDRAHTPADMRAHTRGPPIDRPSSGRTAEKRRHQMPPDARSPADSTRNTCKCSELRS